MNEIAPQDKDKDRKRKISRIAKAVAGAAFLGMSIGVPVQLVRDGVVGAVLTPNPLAQFRPPAIEADNPLTWVATPIVDATESLTDPGSSVPNRHTDFGNQTNPTDQTTHPSSNEPNSQSTLPKGDIVIPENPLSSP